MSRTVRYIDDILVTGGSEDEHLMNLELVLERLKTHGITVSAPHTVTNVSPGSLSFSAERAKDHAGWISFGKLQSRSCERSKKNKVA